jgi:hypothetical protein
MSDEPVSGVGGSSVECTLLAIECPRCGRYSEKQVNWLRDAAKMSCDNCNFTIGLAIGDPRLLIDAVVRRLQASAAVTEAQ